MFCVERRRRNGRLALNVRSAQKIVMSGFQLFGTPSLSHRLGDDIQCPCRGREAAGWSLSFLVSKSSRPSTIITTRYVFQISDQGRPKLQPSLSSKAAALRGTVTNRLGTRDRHTPSCRRFPLGYATQCCFAGAVADCWGVVGTGSSCEERGKRWVDLPFLRSIGRELLSWVGGSLLVWYLPSR